MDAYSNYLIVDPKTAQFGFDKEELVAEAKKRFMSLFQKEPEDVFWCWGYEVACAGPIPEK